MHDLIKLFQEQTSLYRLKEIGDGTHDFTKKVLEQVFGLTPKSTLISEQTLFGDVLYDNFYIYEGSKKQGASARRDFRCKINGQVVVVETERLDNIEAGMKQIGGYMSAENTNFGIVTDGGIWRFFKHGADHLDQYETLTIEQLCSTDGQAFLQNFYNSYDFYLNRLSSVQSKPFDTQLFHQGLITTAERVVFDLRHMKLFTGETKDVAKEEIQTAYSLIIQLLLIKIVQDKRKINLLKKEHIIAKLKTQDWIGIFEEVEKQIKWLGEFYKPYHNQQDQLLNKIISHYQKDSRIAKLNLDSIRLFLDLYHFIYAFDFTQVKQDLFGAVYENYLKELYKDDDTKKGQVFTPPEIVEFMLDEIGYTVDYVATTVEKNLPLLKEHLDDHTYNIDGLSLIDPACGSGTFLYKAAGRIVNALYNLHKGNKITDKEAGQIAEVLICNNIVGFDIEPFPLYLAEMNILQSLLFFNIAADGTVINTIDQPIKIFSTDDSIAEFHNLESSMEKDIQDLIQGGEWATLASKRDPKSILQLKADLQDFDRDALLQKFHIDMYHKELQSQFFIIDSGALIKDKQKTYRDVHHKKITAIQTVAELLDYVRKTLDAKYLPLFEKNTKSLEFKKQLTHITNKLSTVITKAQTKRTKFDFVVANPPYIKYNEIRSGLGIDITNTRPNMNDVYGINLHSIPGYQKKYSPKPNLYSYFNALGCGLAKPGGNVCFIVPEGFVSYDCNNWCLLNLNTLKSLIFFNQRIFLNRGVLGKMETATSAIIYHYKKGQSQNDGSVIIKTNKAPEKGKELKTIITSLTNESFKIKDLIKFIPLGLSITKHSKDTLMFLEQYNNQSDSLSIYYDHIQAEAKLGAKYIFDIGYDFNEKERLYEVNNEQGYYSYFTGKGKYYTNNNGGFWPKERSKIPLGQANQGYQLLDSKFKIILNKTIGFKNPKCRFFEDKEIIRPRNYFMAVGSNDLQGILYLFGLFNSSTTWQILDLYNKIEGEIRDYSVLLPDFKLQIRVPILNTSAKLQLKADLIANSEAIINLCKNGSGGGVQTRGDICETIFDADSLGEKIVGLKSQYQGISITLDPAVMATDKLPDDVLSLLQAEQSDLKKLEDARDAIVRKLYELG